MGRTRNAWVGLACGAALGIGGIVAFDAATESAEAQRGFKVTPGQLQINQKISQAAVRRSNQSLNYLAPIRTTQSDNADTGRNGVRPLSQVPGSGQGWTGSQIADEAITSEKIASGVLPVQKVAAPSTSVTPPAGVETVLAQIDLAQYRTGYTWSAWGSSRHLVAAGTCHITDQNGTSLSSGVASPVNSGGFTLSTGLKTAANATPTAAQLRCTGTGTTTFENALLSVNVAPE